MDPACSMYHQLQLRRRSCSSTTSSNSSTSPQMFYSSRGHVGWYLATGHARWKSRSLTSSPSRRSTSNSSSPWASSWDSMSSEATTCLKFNTNRSQEAEQRCDQQNGNCQQGALLTSAEEGRSSSKGINVTSGQAVSHLAALQHQLELKIEAKLKFSQFLDEVSSRVLRPPNLFVLSRQTEYSRSNSSISSHSNSKSRILDPQQQPGDLDFSQSPDQLQSVDGMQEEQGAPETVGKAYLETDIDCVRREDEINEVKIKKETAITFESNERREVKSPPECHPNPIQRIRPLSPLLYREESLSRYPYRSVSLPRDINMASNEEMQTIRISSGLSGLHGKRYLRLKQE
ncbi:hypothetical protein QQF64_016667 [Cirrhinus molitorella]|uniref:Uncharacterized protein n=1 Tax=Cirrhinus molitorella TaxID=172907 RepID=A0ABR3LNG5_9TELE